MARSRPRIHPGRNRRRRDMGGLQRHGHHGEHGAPRHRRLRSTLLPQGRRRILRPQQRPDLRPQRRRPRQALDILVRREPVLCRPQRRQPQVHQPQEPYLLPRAAAQPDETLLLRPRRKALRRRLARTLRMRQPLGRARADEVRELREHSRLRHTAHTLHGRRKAVGVILRQRLHRLRRHRKRQSGRILHYPRRNPVELRAECGPGQEGQHLDSQQRRDQQVQPADQQHHRLPLPQDRPRRAAQRRPPAAGRKRGDLLQHHRRPAALQPRRNLQQHLRAQAAHQLHVGERTPERRRHFRQGEDEEKPDAGPALPRTGPHGTLQSALLL